MEGGAEDMGRGKSMCHSLLCLLRSGGGYLQRPRYFGDPSVGWFWPGLSGMKSKVSFESSQSWRVQVSKFAFPD